MGIIEDSIFLVYKKSLEKGDLEQAKMALELAKTLKDWTESGLFNDMDSNNQDNPQSIIGSIYNPAPYRYYPDKGVVVITNSAVSLTPLENKLFNIFSQNESYRETLNIITDQDIRNQLWVKRDVSYNLVKIIIYRLRKKIESDAKNPKFLINFYNKGYILFGKRVKEKD